LFLDFSRFKSNSSTMGCSNSKRENVVENPTPRKQKNKTGMEIDVTHGGTVEQANEPVVVGDIKIQDLGDLSSNGKVEDKYRVDPLVLGVGQFATVHPCVNLETGKKCAVKVIKRSNTSENRLSLEISILKQIKGHPNVVGLYDCFCTNTEVKLVMEYVSGGELFDYLVESGPYSEQSAAYHMRRIVSAVEFLHRNEIVHRDLKPENLLLTSKDPKYAEVKVADFGLARICNESVMQTVCGTWAYCAPEVRNDPMGYGPKVDVWSLGVILYVVLAAYHPFDPKGTADEDELWYHAENGIYNFADPIWQSISADARDLIQKMLIIEPSNRLDAAGVLAHPWITGDEHAATPLSPRINIDLNAVNKKFARQKFAGGAKAVWAHAAFASMLSQPAKNNKKSAPQKNKIEEQGGEVEEMKMDVDEETPRHVAIV